MDSVKTLPFAECRALGIIVKSVSGTSAAVHVRFTVSATIDGRSYREDVPAVMLLDKMHNLEYPPLIDAAWAEVEDKVIAWLSTISSVGKLAQKYNGTAYAPKTAKWQALSASVSQRSQSPAV
jgi:hypothetical protein